MEKSANYLINIFINISPIITELCLVSYRMWRADVPSGEGVPRAVLPNVPLKKYVAPCLLKTPRMYTRMIQL